MTYAYPNIPIKHATYYVDKQRLTYYVTDLAQQTLYGLTEPQARAELKAVATGHKEIVQVLDVVPNSKI